MFSRSNGIFFMLIFFMCICLYSGCAREEKPRIAGDQVREYAGALYNQALFTQSIQEYEQYLTQYDLSESEAANISYTIANIYFERLRDYENALTYYLRIKHLYSGSDTIDEVNKRMVECLERLERSADAQQVLEESALLDPSQAKPRRPGTVIAKVGKRQLTTGDLEFEIEQLPPYVKAQFKDRDKKLEFLKQYIATELFYDTAKRKGLDRDKEVIEATFQAKKNLMVQKLLREEISQEVSVKEEDIELYYKANKENYVVKDEDGKIIRTKSFDEVKQTVMQDLIQERQKQAYERLVERMMRAEAVEIYEDRI
jgi:tetratricopeptide (TPR) repeat protein